MPVTRGRSATCSSSQPLLLSALAVASFLTVAALFVNPPAHAVALMFPHTKSCIICLATTFSSLSLAQSVGKSIVLSPAVTASNTAASGPVDPSFAGFGIEPSNLFSFTGGEQPNLLTINLLQNLARYSGTPPHIRVGGNTGDYMIYNASYTDYGIQQNPHAVGQGTYASDSMIIGPSFFKALDRFPKNTPITFGLNLAYQEADYLDNIAKQAKAAVDGMKNVHLYSFEIGNEPDLYLANGFRQPPWDGRVYMDHFLERASAVYHRVLKPAGLPAEFFEPMATASTIGTTFEIDMLVANGITRTINGAEHIAFWNQHDYFYFIGVSGHAISLYWMLFLDNTNAQFRYWEGQVKAGLRTGIPYVLREMCSVGPTGISGISDTFGAALWTLNFFLYAATLNISSVQMHMTDNSYASAWQPTEMFEQKPFIRPPYYAHVAMAQLLGTYGTTRIALINMDQGIPQGYSGFIRAYAAYSDENLQSLVLINSRPANSSLSSKDTLNFTLNLGSHFQGSTFFLSYLTADGSDALTGTTFNGVSFNDADGLPYLVDNSVPKVQASSSGTLFIPVRDSQAVIANVGYRLGSASVETKPEPRPTRGPSTSDDGKTSSTWGTAKKSGASTGSVAMGTAVVTSVVTTTASLAGNLASGTAQETGEKLNGGAEGMLKARGMVEFRKLMLGALALLLVGAFLFW